ncbi:hypothetical protein [Pedosphaera parvula]|nr:hypothetical protein [Pedosphaera parvula]
MRKQWKAVSLGQKVEQRIGCVARSAANYRNYNTVVERSQVVERLYKQVAGRLPKELFKQAVWEAEALASTTPYPLLFLPALAEEKISNMEQWAERQREIRERQPIFATAA